MLVLPSSPTSRLVVVSHQRGLHLLLAFALWVAVLTFFFKECQPRRMRAYPGNIG